MTDLTKLPRVTLDVSHTDPRALNDIVAELRRLGFNVTITQRFNQGAAQETPPAVRLCGQDGWWCHNTCHRHGKCMYALAGRVSK